MIKHHPSFGICHRSSAIRHLRSAFLLLLALALAGCVRISLGGGLFTIATYWPETERKALETEFTRWLAAHGGGKEPVRITWLPLMPGDDLKRLVLTPRRPLDGRSRPLDVVLGGPASSYVRLAETGRLLPVERPEHPLWCVSRHTTIGMAVGPAADRAPVEESRGWPSIFDDPRHDPVALAWAKFLLVGDHVRNESRRSWASGYAELVRAAGHPRRIGRQAGAAIAEIERGAAAMTPVINQPGHGVLPGIVSSGDDVPLWYEGVAIVKGGDNPSLAQRFLEFLAEWGQAEPPPKEPDDPDTDALIADLLGATLVDAQEELWTAWETLKKEGPSERAERARRWMTEAPPWPPASVETLRSQDSSGALLATLAGQVAPDAEVRAGLVRSWLAPRRLIDGRLLAELSGAAGGKLAREPRFRAWLRAEWTAWARQRYRRAARLARGTWP